MLYGLFLLIFSYVDYTLIINVMSLYYIFVSGKPLNGLPRWLSSKESTCQSQRCWRYRFNPRKIPWRREQQLTPASILASIIPRPEEHGGLQVMGCKELEMTEQAHDLFENISFCLFDVYSCPLILPY